MKNFNIFGYSITIRKTRTRHPMDTRAYHGEIQERKAMIVTGLKRENKARRTQGKIKRVGQAYLVL